MDIGARLRQAREGHGLTLQQIGDITKLPMTTLVRIERNEFDTLPGGILVKGYLRAYAITVGLAPEEIVDAYLAQYADARTSELWPTTTPFDRPNRSPALPAAVVVTAVVVACSWHSCSGDRAQESLPATQGRPSAAAALAHASALPASRATSSPPATAGSRAAPMGSARSAQRDSDHARF
jgi:cytoskeleton protein RodZ